MVVLESVRKHAVDIRSTYIPFITTGKYTTHGVDRSNSSSVHSDNFRETIANDVIYEIKGPFLYFRRETTSELTTVAKSVIQEYV